ncbi:MAG: NAD-dependent epimerase/dehydratase family protein [Myxococcota bacterium]|jgi:UDP-glucose 4-epimerase|nr:NAD-dependent epimerase/dehydratase family protein [Myxococcota bacterium]
MKKVLITGGAGFIGSHLCDRLVEQGDEVIVLDNLTSGNLGNLAGVIDQITFIEDDVTRVLDHRDAFEGVTHIVHLAALISGYDSLNEPDDYLAQNVGALLRVLELARDLGGVRISFASSSTVYGNSVEPIKLETQRPEPITMYALTKLSGEHLLEMYRPLYNYSYVALRFFNVYGPRQSPNHPYANVTCKFSQAAALGAGIKLFGDGQQTRDFVYVDDVVNSLLVTMDGAPSNLYNVGNGEDHSILKLIDTLEGIVEKPFEIERCDPWPNDIRKIIADTERLTSETSWRATTSLRDGLARTVEFFQAEEQA